MAELREILFLDPTTFPAPHIPLLIGRPREVGVLIPGDPSDAAGENICFDAWSEVMAKESYTRQYSYKVFEHMCKNSHTSHAVGGEV
jgi:hypothetical protein